MPSRHYRDRSLLYKVNVRLQGRGVIVVVRVTFCAPRWGEAVLASAQANILDERPAVLVAPYSAESSYARYVGAHNSPPTRRCRAY